ncbi:amidase domain-containing protein [Bacillus sp. AGMB 02131]|uniref:Amidase domain-containing protein n=1 Tax=Peribacillus faecalis TaxID=2772559 RepID=A0A927CSP2_9BACI|nr:amidase domain-containing protein [Peribacillus faecalis]MBD3107163.1 amidase domain-containing protein [Peribacillus faecalis]
MTKRLEQYLQERCDRYVREFEERDDAVTALKVGLLKERGAQILNVKANARNIKRSVQGNQEIIRYEAHWQYFIKQKDFYYIEEENKKRIAVFEDGECLSETEIQVPQHPDVQEELQLKEAPDFRQYEYNRLKAVQYAERYWQEYNPAYHAFEDDCTNFISQCLHAGGVPMWGKPNRGNGWWYSGKSWSYSWTVAHALKLLLQSPKGGPKATKVSSPDQLELGDVICYDFEGDGRTNHTTIVTAKDYFDMPLVNAHTFDSRQRYWSYEDSTKYTPQMKYTFFHIENDE